MPVAKANTFDFKPVWMGYIHPNKLGAKDKDGLPYGIPDTMGKEVDNFEALLDEFGAAGYEPCLQVSFRSGDAYLITRNALTSLCHRAGGGCWHGRRAAPPTSAGAGR